MLNGLAAYGLSWRSACAGSLFSSRSGGALLAILALLACSAGHARAQEGTVKAQHGAWQIVCKDPPPGAKNEVCALVQSVTAEDRDNIGLTVYFQKFSNGTRVLRVFAPLGILLPPGLGLKIDDKDVGHAPFLRCHTFACYAQVVVDDPLVEQLKQGKTAIFIIFQTEEAGIGIPISLAGFKDALAELKGRRRMPPAASRNEPAVPQRFLKGACALTRPCARAPCPRPPAPSSRGA